MGQLVRTLESKTKTEAKKQVNKVVDKVFPPFDHHTADTENNKIRFKDFLHVEITPDVKNIYCFDNAIGIDASYLFSFNCNKETSSKIIEVNKLRSCLKLVFRCCLSSILFKSKADLRQIASLFNEN